MPFRALMQFDLRRSSVMRSVPSAVADGSHDYHWQLPISDWLLAIEPILQSAIEIPTVGTHPLPRTVLTSLPLRRL